MVALRGLDLVRGGLAFPFQHGVGECCYALHACTVNYIITGVA